MEQNSVDVMNSVDFNTAQNFAYRLGAYKLDAVEYLEDSDHSCPGTLGRWKE
jgi:hypothetical protein